MPQERGHVEIVGKFVNGVADVPSHLLNDRRLLDGWRWWRLHHGLRHCRLLRHGSMGSRAVSCTPRGADRRRVGVLNDVWLMLDQRLLLRLFRGGDVWYKWALYDRDPIAQWTSGRATVLGDAAHPMLPYLGQGACQAVEDGCVLAAALAATPDDLPGALARYDRARRPRASAVVLAARARGVENHLTSPLAALKRDALIAMRKRFGGGGEARGGGWIWEYDAGSAEALTA